jgi:hypothetical protein
MLAVIEEGSHEVSCHHEQSGKPPSLSHARVPHRT